MTLRFQGAEVAVTPLTGHGTVSRRPSVAFDHIDTFSDAGGDEDDAGGYNYHISMFGRNWLLGAVGLHTACSTCTPAALSQIRGAIAQVSSCRFTLQQRLLAP